MIVPGEQVSNVFRVEGLYVFLIYFETMISALRPDKFTKKET